MYMLCQACNNASFLDSDSVTSVPVGLGMCAYSLVLECDHAGCVDTVDADVTVDQHTRPCRLAWCFKHVCKYRMWDVSIQSLDGCSHSFLKQHFCNIAITLLKVVASSSWTFSSLQTQTDSLRQIVRTWSTFCRAEEAGQGCVDSRMFRPVSDIAWWNLSTCSRTIHTDWFSWRPSCPIWHFTRPVLHLQAELILVVWCGLCGPTMGDVSWMCNDILQRP